MRDVVTGAFSYSGAAVAAELRRRGRAVRTLTNHPAPEALGMEVHPLDLTNPDALRRSLTGVDVLYNTYWVRFPHGEVTFDAAVEASARLFEAAAEAGVRRIVHVSITHADVASPYAYFRGKGRVERSLAACGVSHAVVRPAILFGGEGVLINNIAWLMRRFPVMLVGGGGDYRVRGIHVADLATLMADLGDEEGTTTTDAVGPQSLAFVDLLGHLRTATGSHTRFAPVPGRAFPAVTWALGRVLRDTLLTREEYLAMADGLADSDAPSTGATSITEWIARNGDSLGRTYAHELRRHFLPRPDRTVAGADRALSRGRRGSSGAPRPPWTGSSARRRC
ncbi:MAG TPA: NAD-dependent epimerase/dehydratase family protein [Nocardioides sp.]|uniref:SDR family oxidoreductase n=1 Tax=Nocardioides sp. TaxID=35761 RepID=UPI002E2F735A|nr:NAD-dependent epimerase/dehydratase family protein [Nocardioides sp.]HEX3930245.1 NAD-dependent epimerase/dehydratase family protein [Nocardioides sp.]